MSILCVGSLLTIIGFVVLNMGQCCSVASSDAGCRGYHTWGVAGMGLVQYSGGVIILGVWVAWG